MPWHSRYCKKLFKVSQKIIIKKNLILVELINLNHSCCQHLYSSGLGGHWCGSDQECWVSCSSKVSWICLKNLTKLTLPQCLPIQFLCLLWCHQPKYKTNIAELVFFLHSILNKLCILKNSTVEAGTLFIVSRQKIWKWISSLIFFANLGVTRFGKKKSRLLFLLLTGSDAGWICCCPLTLNVMFQCYVMEQKSSLQSRLTGPKYLP